MRRMLFVAAATCLGIAPALAGDFDEALCVASASDEGFENVESLCSCLAEEAAADEELDAALALMQVQAPEERDPPEHALDAINACSA